MPLACGHKKGLCNFCGVCILCPSTNCNFDHGKVGTGNKRRKAPDNHQYVKRCLRKRTGKSAVEAEQEALKILDEGIANSYGVPKSKEKGTQTMQSISFSPIDARKPSAQKIYHEQEEELRRRLCPDDPDAFGFEKSAIALAELYLSAAISTYYASFISTMRVYDDMSVRLLELVSTCEPRRRSRLTKIINDTNESLQQTSSFLK